MEKKNHEEQVRKAAYKEVKNLEREEEYLRTHGLKHTTRYRIVSGQLEILCKYLGIPCE